jgi:hypothetical protein
VSLKFFVAEILQSGGSALTDSARLDTLVAASGLKVSIDPNVFAAVWRAWRERHSLDAQCLNAKGKICSFTLSPRVSAWCIKEEESEREWKGVYAVHRIKSAAVPKKRSIDLNFGAFQIKILRVGANPVTRCSLPQAVCVPLVRPDSLGCVCRAFAQAPKLTALPRSGRFAGLIPLLGEERQTLPPFDHGQPSGWTLYLFKLKNLHSVSYIILQPHPIKRLPAVSNSHEGGGSPHL